MREVLKDLGQVGFETFRSQFDCSIEKFGQLDALESHDPQLCQDLLLADTEHEGTMTEFDVVPFGRGFDNRSP